MAHFTFDGPNLHIICKNTEVVDGVFSFTAQSLYSEWKDWVQSGAGAQYPEAFRTVGGDPISATISIGDYYFLRNDTGYGWHLVPPTTDPVEINISGNLYREDTSATWMQLGPNTVTVFSERSQLTQVGTVVTGSGVTAQDKTDIINGILTDTRTLTKPDFMGLR